MSRDPNYCGTCYSAAAKHGRKVSLTQFYAYPVCTLCEARLREGLVHYIPSNGSEGRGFESRCEDCRHHIPDLGGNNEPNFPSLTPPYGMCKWGILDRLVQSGWNDYDHAASWYSPLDMKDTGECLRFTHKDDRDDSRDPPRPVDPNQMTFADLDIPVEQAGRVRMAAETPPLILKG